MGMLAPRIIASEGEVRSVELELEVDTLEINGRGANEVAMFGSVCEVRQEEKEGEIRKGGRNLVLDSYHTGY
jgi:hypothetical protein